MRSGVYAIADEGAAQARGVPMEELLSSLCQAAPAVIQLRWKTPDTGRGAAAMLLAAKQLARDAGDALWVVNDRVDVASLANAPGVHLGQDDLGIQEARAMLPARSVVGLSTHSLEQVREARVLGADYIGFGPIFPTRSKSGLGAGLGLALLGEAVALAGELPVVAIGGITLKQMPEIARSGARAAAVIGALFAGEDVVSELRRLEQAFLEGGET